MSTPHSLTKRLAVVASTLFLCSGWASAQQGVPATRQTEPQTGTTTVVDIEEMKEQGGVMSQLIASNLNYRDTTLVTDFARVFNESLHLDELTEEDLMYPSIELYGEDSWVDDDVNPIRGSHAKVTIPDRYEIDLKEFVYPLDGVRRVNSRYGYRRRFGRMHYGIDLDLDRGDTVRAAFSGRVRMVKFDRRGYGNYVVIRHPNGLETLYGHLSKQLVKPDAIVRAGDPIGLGGSTGRSTGPHLHFETRFMGIALNPEHLINFTAGIPIRESYAYVKKSGRGSSRTQVAASSGNNSFKTYRVRKGDTLSGIAQKTGTSVSRIRKLNPKLGRSSMIYPGDVIRISA